MDEQTMKQLTEIAILIEGAGDEEEANEIFTSVDVSYQDTLRQILDTRLRERTPFGAVVVEASPMKMMRSTPKFMPSSRAVVAEQATEEPVGNTNTEEAEKMIRATLDFLIGECNFTPKTLAKVSRSILAEHGVSLSGPNSMSNGGMISPSSDQSFSSYLRSGG